MKFPSISELYSLYKKFPVVTTDSRKVSSQSIFFALRGENFNGNEFAQTAIQQGCAYTVIDEEKFYSGEKTILVKDVLQTLQHLALHHRSQLKIPILAITGSNGKTTTKELIKNVLSKKYKTLATVGNLNNHIGVPLTILSITDEIEIAIVEMGANHIGEIAMLCEIAKPDFGLITNIGKAHLGEFGNFENVVKGKKELYQFIRNNNGKIFLNSDNELLVSLTTDLEKITYGTKKNSFCQCKMEDSFPFLKIKFNDKIVSSQLFGKYNFENIASTICIGKYFKVENEKIKEAIEEYVPSNNRSQILKTKSNTLLLDAYNANPSSMCAAIENFSEMEGKNKWLILGDMLELGKYEIEEHKNILQLLVEKKFQNIILVGEIFSKAVSEGKNKFLLFKNSDELANRLKSNSPIKKSSLILIKGSRGIKLEKVVDYL